MRGVKKNSLIQRVFFFFFLKLFFLSNFTYLFSFFNSNSVKFFYFLFFQFFFLNTSLPFFKLTSGLNEQFFKKEVNQFFKDNIHLYELSDEVDNSQFLENTEDFFFKFFDTQIIKNKYNLEYFLQKSASAERSNLSVSLFKPDVFNANNNLFLYNYTFNRMLAQIPRAKLNVCNLNKVCFFFNTFPEIKLFKFINFFFKNFLFFTIGLCIKKKKIHNNFCILNSFFFFKKFVFGKKRNVELKPNLRPFMVLKQRSKNYFLLRKQKQVFLNKYFSIFSHNFFFNFVPFGLKFSVNTNINQKILSALLFLPDRFLFLNYSGFIIKEKKYTNIIPLFNLKLNLKFRRKKSLPLKNTNIFLWYLLNFFESKLQKPMFLKLIYSRKAIFKKSIYLFCIKVFRKLKRFNYRFKRNFFLGEIIRVIVVSLMSRDATLFINYITWVLMQIPYKDLKGFLYFLKVILKKYLLPNFKNSFLVKGFIFDIRGKVGVTGDAKKRHTLISWGQSSFSEKNLKMSLKQGLVYTRTGVMGVTVIIIF